MTRDNTSLPRTDDGFLDMSEFPSHAIRFGDLGFDGDPLDLVEVAAPINIVGLVSSLPFDAQLEATDALDADIELPEEPGPPELLDHIDVDGVVDPDGDFDIDL